MAMIDIRDYSVIKKAKLAQANEIVLEQLDDEVVLTGPVNVAVRLQAINKTTTHAGEVFTHYHDVYQYNWTIPAGQDGVLKASESLQQLRLGANHGSRIVITPAILVAPPPVRTTGELPCDFAVGDIPNTGQFFPAGCEPCPPGKSIALPPGTTPTLITAPAPGGCVRTRFFNGMFITREDMETEQRFFRMKNKLQNQTFGDGVVWGLDVTCAGDSICVHPGYALDCCGNTLVVTTPYKVPLEALLRDPGAFQFLMRRPTATSAECADTGFVNALDRVRGLRAQLPEGTRRMYLLLEYVECPEAPRPVHGDACSPDVTSCEMSRIRETVRLRLVPPRRTDTRGPIEKFLKEVAKLKKAGTVQDVPSTPVPGTAPQPGTGLQPSATAPGTTVNFVPFRIELQFVQLPVVTLQPNVSLPQTSDLVMPLPTSFEIRMIAAANYNMVSGTLERPDGTTVQMDPSNPVPLRWTVNVAEVNSDLPPVTQTFIIRTWVAAPLFGNEEPNLTGTTTIRVTSALRRVITVVEPTVVTAVETNLGPYPCPGDACGEDSLGGLLNLLPPFLHVDPFRPPQAVDWKVLAMAATYGFLAQEMARHRVGTPNQVVTERLNLAFYAYRYALRLLFRDDLTPAEALKVSQELRCLFQLWCRSFIYPGPQCNEEPIGVVIGCVRIQGGTIRELDPLGGRRWVVSYPLLSYWGRLFGIAPLDETISRVFNMICCISELPVVQTPRDAGDISGGRTVWRNSQSVLTRNVMLVEGTPQQAMAELAKVNIQPVQVRTVGLAEFVRNMTTGLRTRDVPPGTSFELLSLRDTPGVHIAVPIEAAIPPSRTAPVTDAVRTSVGKADRQNVPVLVRAGAEDLSVNILNEARIAGLDNSAVAAEFKAANIQTHGALLSRDPENVAREVLAGKKTKEFSTLYRESERQAETVAKAVNEAMTRVSTEMDISTPDELRSEEAIKAVTTALARPLGNVVTPEVLELVVRNTLLPKRGPTRSGSPLGGTRPDTPGGGTPGGGTLGGRVGGTAGGTVDERTTGGTTDRTPKKPRKKKG